VYKTPEINLNFNSFIKELKKNLIVTSVTLNS
jgi:hypothetical protein